MKCPIDKVKMDYIEDHLLRKTNGQIATFRFYECKECGKQEYRQAMKERER